MSIIDGLELDELRDKAAKYDLLVVALKPFMEVGKRLKPVSGPDGSFPIPFGASANRIRLEPLMAGDFVKLYDIIVEGKSSVPAKDK